MLVNCAARAARPLSRPLARIAGARAEAFSTEGASAGEAHLAAAAKQMGRLKDAPPALEVKNVGVIGGGLMGSGIATSLALTGHDVLIKEVNDEAAAAGVERVRSNVGRRVKAGRMTEDQYAAVEARVRGVTDYALFGDRHLVIESVVEKMPLKQQVFEEVQASTPEECVIATNTSSMDITEIATPIHEKGRVCGMHYFSPAHIMPLLEIVRTPQTSLQTLATAVAVAHASKKSPVVVGNCIGFALNRMFSFYIQVAYLLVESGVSPYRVDKAVSDFGLPMGPFRMSDLAGVDVVRNADLVIHNGYAYCFTSVLPKLLVEAGRLGEKTGKGYYDFGAVGGRTAEEDEAAIQPLLEAARHAGQQTNPQLATVPGFTDEQLVELMMYPVVNEAYRILSEGHADTKSDLDVASVMSYGWPAKTGGPLFWAEQRGLGHVVDTLLGACKTFGEPIFQPCDALRQAARR